MSEATGHSYGQDQASSLRKLLLRRRGVTTVAVASGKGGVGKSNIAANIAVYLADRGVRVVLADLDLGLANLDLLLGLQPRHTLAHVLGGLKTIDEVMQIGPGGVLFLPGASGMGNIANLSDFERHSLLVYLRKLDLNADIVVLDCGAGISRNVISFAQAADLALVVTTPEPTAVTDAYALIKTLLKDAETPQIRLVVNMASSRNEAGATYARVAGVAKRFLNYPLADGGFLLHDTVVELAVRERKPFVLRHPGSNASACIAAIASELARACGTEKRCGGFLRRVAGLFV